MHELFSDSIRIVCDVDTWGVLFNRFAHTAGPCVHTFKNRHFSTNSLSTPLGLTLRGGIDPVDSENDNENIDSIFASKTFIFT